MKKTIYSEAGELRHEVYYDDENGVARIVHYDLIYADDAREFLKILEVLYTDKSPKLLLDDSSRVSAAKMDKETRQIFMGAGEKLGIDKVAVFGADPMTRMMSKIIFTIAGKIDSTKYFKTEDEALKWLKGEAS
ncbi:hypothetical protein GF338_09735 [candidate division WOR-3 bacterium]|nr:hypothetical protein [candidate division WOR-3 bacterium]